MVVLGIDVGTTGCKALAVDEEGRVIGQGYEGYGLATQGGGRVEQDPQDWIRGMTAAVGRALAGLDAGRVGALALSTQAASSLLVDRDFAPLTPAITWMDTRAVPEAEEIAGELGGDRIYRISGWRAHGALDMAKARWLARHEPALWRRADSFVSTLEYMNHYLTGKAVIDPTNAALRQLMDIRTRMWDPCLLEAAGLSPAMLPPILPSGAELGWLTSHAAAALGLPEGVRVFNGAHDQYCGALGAGLIDPGELMVSTGTAWVVLGITLEPAWSSHFISPGPHVVPGRFGALASLPASGAALDWLRTRVSDMSYEDLNRQAAGRIMACRDVFFYPHLAGAGFPDWDSRAKAAFTGLTMDCDRMDMALACMEGVAFEFRRTLDAFADSGIPMDSLRVMGGAARSPLWLSILAALWGRPVRVMNVRDTACVGAAILAGVGAGVFADCRQAAQCLGGSVWQDPDPVLIGYYGEKYRRYQRNWQCLRMLYEE